MTKDELRAIARLEAAEAGVDPRLLCGIISAESAWDPWAVRYEPNFGYVLDANRHAKANRISLDTERCLQRISWGLTQMMGGTARAAGYTGPIPRLVDPRLNIQWGAKFLRSLADRYGLLTDQIAAYNSGKPRRDLAGIYHNQIYVDRVSRAMAEES